MNRYLCDNNKLFFNCHFIMDKLAYRFRFPNLDGLRGLMAMGVLIAHVEAIKGEYRLPNLADYPVFMVLPDICVTGFLVLSGFLITFLLLREKRDYKTIDLWAFYYRRARRIWPLYVLVSILVLYVLPFILLSYPEDRKMKVFYPDWVVLYFIFFIQNSVATVDMPLMGGHTWSIALEEQFYTFWGLGMKYISPIWLILIGLISTLIMNTLDNLGLIEFNLRSFQFESLIIGSALAWFYMFKNKYIQFLLHPLWLMTGILLCIYTCINDKFRLVGYVYVGYALICMIIIYNLAVADYCSNWLEAGWLKELGKISYGIYMYHFPITWLVIGGLNGSVSTFKSHLSVTGIWQNVLIYGSISVLTVLAAKVSYYYYESYFLKKS
jgi:peptidoglycan/LPS O-acetylase OafA/YrhL